MKSIVKLNIQLEVVCSQDFADRLQSEELADIVVNTCFKNNQRRVIDVNVQDVELVDSTVNTLKLLESRESCKAQADAPNPLGATKSDDSNFISLL